MKGKQLGPYLIDAEIARGGMAKVFVATHASLGHKVGLKVLRRHLFRDAQYRARFMEEARVLANMHHPNILSVRDILELPDVAGIVMELLSGCPLNEFYRTVRLPLPPPQVVRLFTELSGALHHVHQTGVIHRDLKPSNVFLHCERDQVIPKLMDFGIAKVDTVADGKRLTALGAVLGTPQFMAPEQFRDPSGVTAAADVFSLGVMMYEAVAARLPFDGPATTDVMHQVLTREPPRPSELVSQVPGDLETVIQRCLAKERADRYPDAESLRRALVEVGKRVGVEAVRVRTVPKTTVIEQEVSAQLASSVVAPAGGADRLQRSLARAEPRPRSHAPEPEFEPEPESVEELPGDEALEAQQTIKFSARSIPGYRILEKLSAGTVMDVYRGLHLESGQRVLLKLPRDDDAEPAVHAALLREHELLAQLDIEGVVANPVLVETPRGPVLVTDDRGYRPLKRVIAASKPELSEALGGSIRVAELLGGLHQANVVHQNLNPGCILVGEEPHQVELMDLALAVRLAGRTRAQEVFGPFDGDLAYVSPEQTGRMNRPVDYRTDFYSLGVVLYECLVGRRPFESTDRAELLHAHIAQRPTPPAEVDGGVPVVVSDIVMKLLSKAAEARYQSVSGLLADLRECARRLKDAGYVDAFELGREDTSKRFRLPDRLYGREIPLRRLLDGFHRVRQGYLELALVTGPGGVGKTSLVDELYKPVTAARGFCLKGKFEQFKRDLPYAALIEAFQGLIRELLTEDRAVLARWRDRIAKAVEPNGRVLTDVIPELALIIGPQADVFPLAPAEARNRWTVVFRNFMRVFAREDHPLVLFLDDLQWADNASLALLQLMLAGPDSLHLYVIGAYRDNEVDATHPLQVTLNELEQLGRKAVHIALGPLARKDVGQLVADTLGAESGDVLPLTRLLFGRSGGNPFHLGELLYAAHGRDGLHFDDRTGRWRWNLDILKDLGVAEDVVALMAEQIQLLKTSSQRAITVGACVGRTVDVALMARVSGSTEEALQEALQPAVALGFLTLLGGGLYRFAHDRIQQAAYSLVPEAERLETARRVGRMLLEEIDAEEREQRIFDIVNPLNASISLVTDPGEQLELAELNLIAARRAKASTAYESAFDYLEKGLALLGPERWQDHYELCLALCNGAAEAAYLTRRFSRMDELVTEVEERAATVLDRVQAVEIRIASLIAQRAKEEVVETGLAALRLLGVRLPRKPNLAQVALALLRTKVALLGKGIERLRALPEMEDRLALATMRVSTIITSTAYTVTPNLFPMIVLKQLLLTLRYGSSILSPFTWAVFGTLHCGFLGRPELGYQYGKLSLDLLEQLGVVKERAQVLFVHASTIQHYKEPLSATLPVFKLGYRRALEVGDFEFAAASAGGYAYGIFFSGANLQRVNQELSTYAEATAQLNQPTYLSYLRIYRQAVLNLRGDVEQVRVLRGDSCDVEVLQAELEEAGDMHGVFQCLLQRSILAYLLGDYEEAVGYTTEARKVAFSVAGMFPALVLDFYDSLARLAWARKAPKPRRVLRPVAANQRRLAKLARHAPQNHQHKWLLVEAERARNTGRTNRAMELYDRSIELAQEHGFQQELACANERAARCALAAGRTKVARTYLADAHYSYRAWGAFAKVEQLEQEHGDLLLAVSRSSSRGRSSAGYGSSLGSSLGGSRASSATYPGQLDPKAIIQAMKALSAERRLEPLLTRAIQLAVEHGGAQRGVLVLERDGQYVLEAEASIDLPRPRIRSGEPIGSRVDVAQAVVNFVMRTRETVVLDDATLETGFDRDPHIVAAKPCSLLCQPLLRDDQLLGLLYLENNLVSGVFTAARQEGLVLIADEMVRCLVNARAFGDLESRAEELERRLVDAEAELAKARDEDS